MLCSLLDTPVGRLRLVGTRETLVEIHLASGRRATAEIEAEVDDQAFSEARHQLTAYFAGRLREFDLPTAPRGTVFQQQVWRALQAIPYGATASYGDIACAIGRPTAVRAVGLANGANPIPIVIPCHRVIGRDGSLTGYGGGLEVKAFLLRLEGALAALPDGEIRGRPPREQSRPGDLF